MTSGATRKEWGVRQMEAAARGGFDEQVPTADNGGSIPRLASGVWNASTYGGVWNTSHGIQGRENCGIYPPTSMCHWFRAAPGKPLCTPVCPHSPHRPSTPRSQQKSLGILRFQQWDATSMAHWSGEWQVSTGRAVTMSASCYMYGIVIESVVSDSLRSHGL